MDRRLLALAVITLALYARTLGYPLVYEDRNDLEAFSRPWPLSGDVIGDALRHPTRLLRDVSFSISGTDAVGAHAGNVVLHLVNGFLLYRVALWWVPSGVAVFAAGLFWLHPVQVESVAYVSSRADLVATLLLLLTVLSRRRIWCCLLLAVATVLAKETFVAVLLIPLVVGSWDRVHRVLWGVWLAIALPVGLYGLLLFGADPDLRRVGLIYTQLARLLALWVLPWPLTIEHDWALITPLVMGITFALVLGWLWFELRRPVPVLGAAVVLIAIFFLPRVFVPLSEGLHEHHLYAPSLALSLSTAWALKGS